MLHPLRATSMPHFLWRCLRRSASFSTTSSHCFMLAQQCLVCVYLLLPCTRYRACCAENMILVSCQTHAKQVTRSGARSDHLSLGTTHSPVSVTDKDSVIILFFIQRLWFLYATLRPRDISYPNLKRSRRSLGLTDLFEPFKRGDRRTGMRDGNRSDGIERSI